MPHTGRQATAALPPSRPPATLTECVECADLAQALVVDHADATHPPGTVDAVHHAFTIRLERALSLIDYTEAVRAFLASCGTDLTDLTDAEFPDVADSVARQFGIDPADARAVVVSLIVEAA